MWLVIGQQMTDSADPKKYPEVHLEVQESASLRSFYVDFVPGQKNLKLHSRLLLPRQKHKTQEEVSVNITKPSPSLSHLTDFILDKTVDREVKQRLTR